MAVIDSLQRSFLISSTLSKELDASKKEVSNVKNSIDNISKIIETRTKVKGQLISTSILLQNRRKEASRRKEIEDLGAASKVRTSTRGGLNVAQSSGQGPLERILTFLGFIGAGWILENLPTWIAIGEEFSRRVRLSGQLMFNFVNGIKGIIKAFGNILSSIGSNIISLDLFDSSNKIENSFKELNETTDTLGTQIEDGFKALMAPLGIQVPGLEEERPDTSERPESPAGSRAATPPPPPGSNYNISQLVGLAQQAGFKGKNAAVAAAVAMAESGGRTDAHNNVPPDDSYGLWQINMLDDGPARRQKFGISSNEELFNPNTNAKAAFILSGGSDFSAWTMYTNDGYKKFLAEAEKALPNPQSPPAQTPTVTADNKNSQDLVGQTKNEVGNNQITGIESALSSIVPQTPILGTNTGITSTSSDTNITVQPQTPIISGNTTTPQIDYSGMTTAQLKSMLRTDRAQTKEELAATTAARQKAKEQGLSAEETERQVYIATLSASSEAKAADQSIATQAQVSSLGTRQQVSSEITPERKGQEIIVESPRPFYNTGQGVAPAAAPSGGGVTPVGEYDMLNNFIKNKLLLDLAYL